MKQKNAETRSNRATDIINPSQNSGRIIHAARPEELARPQYTKELHPQVDIVKNRLIAPLINRFFVYLLVIGNPCPERDLSRRNEMRMLEGVERKPVAAHLPVLASCV
ncbi:MAG: hypothetical protein ACRECW_00765 [Phyllobacterium sp.]